MIEGERTKLRLIKENDLDTLAACLSGQSAGPYYPGCFESLVGLRARYFKDGFWSEDDGRMIIENEESRLIGWIFHFHWHPVSDAHEIAYIVFGEDDRNKGHASAALSLFSHFLFRTMPIHRLELNIARENVFSIHVAEKAGYSMEGLSRDAWFSPALGRRIDGLRYALLREDLEGEKRPGQGQDLMGIKFQEEEKNG